jgi:hypothetical protein
MSGERRWERCDRRLSSDPRLARATVSPLPVEARELLEEEMRIVLG